MNRDDLNLLVSESIRRVELLEDLGAPSARSGWLELSLLEEKLARLEPADSPEGVFARRGAVNAALMARELERAEKLCDEFGAESPRGLEAMAPLRAEIGKRLGDFASRFPFAARKFGAAELLNIARKEAGRSSFLRMVA